MDASGHAPLRSPLGLLGSGATRAGSHRRSALACRARRASAWAGSRLDGSGAVPARSPGPGSSPLITRSWSAVAAGAASCRPSRRRAAALAVAGVLVLGMGWGGSTIGVSTGSPRVRSPRTRRHHGGAQDRSQGATSAGPPVAQVRRVEWADGLRPSASSIWVSGTTDAACPPRRPGPARRVAPGPRRPRASPRRSVTRASRRSSSSRRVDAPGPVLQHVHPCDPVGPTDRRPLDRGVFPREGGGPAPRSAPR